MSRPKAGWGFKKLDKKLVQSQLGTECDPAASWVRDIYEPCMSRPKASERLDEVLKSWMKSWCRASWERNAIQQPAGYGTYMNRACPGLRLVKGWMRF